MIVIKGNLLEKLKENGYNTTRIRKEKLLGESVLQKLREGRLPSWNELNRICTMLEVQPGDLLEYVPDRQESK